uniref:Uncharacterized protein n=1 Tax=Schistosoma mansoni TaxID=6183 RepID=A0A5K4F343_SCHMA
MDKPTTIKEAIKKWEEKTGQKASEATEVKLYGQYPPIEKMDASLSTLTMCEYEISYFVRTNSENYHFQLTV